MTFGIDRHTLLRRMRKLQHTATEIISVELPLLKIKYATSIQTYISTCPYSTKTYALIASCLHSCRTE